MWDGGGDPHIIMPKGLILVGSAGPDTVTSPLMPKFMTFMGYMTRRSGPSLICSPCRSTLSTPAGCPSVSDGSACDQDTKR